MKALQRLNIMTKNGSYAYTVYTEKKKIFKEVLNNELERWGFKDRAL